MITPNKKLIISQEYLDYYARETKQAAGVNVGDVVRVQYVHTGIVYARQIENGLPTGTLVAIPYELAAKMGRAK